MRRAWIQAIMVAAVVMMVAVDTRADLALFSAPNLQGYWEVARVSSSGTESTSPAPAKISPSRASASSGAFLPIGGVTASGGWAKAGLFNFEVPADWAGSAVPERIASVASGHEVRELPPLPSSAALYLSAVASIGSWYVLRSARFLHWGTLPEWYHTGGPDQIAHAVAFDLLNFTSPMMCEFEQPVVDRQAVRMTYRERIPRWDKQFWLQPRTPRAPPFVSQAMDLG